MNLRGNPIALLTAPAFTRSQRQCHYTALTKEEHLSARLSQNVTTTVNRFEFLEVFSARGEEMASMLTISCAAARWPDFK